MSEWRKICDETIETGSEASPRPWVWREDKFTSDECYYEFGPGVVEYAGCGTHLIYVTDCNAAYIVAATAHADRLARFALALADGHGDYSFLSVEERDESLAELWELSKSAP